MFLDVGAWDAKSAAAGALAVAAPALTAQALSRDAKHATAPAAVPDPPPVAPPAGAPALRTIKALPGDTPWKIAERYGASRRLHWWREIRDANPQKAPLPFGRWGWKILLVGDPVILPAEWPATVPSVEGFLDDAAKAFNDATTEVMPAAVPPPSAAASAPEPDGPRNMQYAAQGGAPVLEPKIAPGPASSFTATKNPPPPKAAPAAPPAPAPSAPSAKVATGPAPASPATAPTAAPSATSALTLPSVNAPKVLGVAAVLAFLGAGVTGAIALKDVLKGRRK